MMANLVRWNPFDELQITDTLDRLVNRWRSDTAWNESPIYASIDGVDDGYRVRIPLPGVAPEHVTVDVTGRHIHVRVIERDGDTEVSRYEKVLTLPASVGAEQIGATFRHGLLELMLRYHDTVKPRRLEIVTGEPKQLPEAA